MNAPVTIAHTANPTPLAQSILTALALSDLARDIELHGPDDSWRAADTEALEARRRMLAAFADLGVTADMIRKAGEIL